MFYVMSHKAFDDRIVPKKGYKVLWLSKEMAPKQDYIRDADYADNIADKNHHFSELSGYYWIWKNGKEKPDDFIGIVHYRTFFYWGFKKLSFSKACKLLKKYDIILPVKSSFAPMTVEEQYNKNHKAEDLQKTRSIIGRLCPEYLPAFEKVLAENGMWIRDLMITPKQIFDEYCSWLFPILDAIEEETDYSTYDGTYQERLPAFLAERLMNTWIVANADRLRIKQVLTLMEDISTKLKIKMILYHFLKGSR